METGQKRTQQNNKITDSENMILSIQVSLNGLSFCILDQKANHIIYVKKITLDKKATPDKLLEHLKSAFNTEKELQQDFGKVQVIHENELSTLVPEGLFNEGHLADYLKFNSRILKTDYIATDRLAEHGLVTVYVPYMNVNNYIYDQFGEFNYLHCSSVLIKSVLNRKSSSEARQIIVHLASRHFEIISTRNSKLEIYNTFNYNTKEDFIYYLLFTLEQLSIDPEKAHMAFIGDISEDDEIFEMAYKYIRDFEVLPFEHGYGHNKKAISSADYVLINSF